MSRPLVVLAAVVSVGFAGVCSAREHRYQGIDLGPARTQRSLSFYRDLPDSRRQAEKQIPQTLPCGTPVTPVAFQVVGEGDDAIAFISFIAPHANGHILADDADRAKLNLLDYVLFDAAANPFCVAKLEQTLSQCGNVGVSLVYNSDSVLQAEIQNLSTNQVLFIDWSGTRLMSDGRSLSVLPSDVFLQALERELPGRSSALFYDINPLSDSSTLGLGNRAGLHSYTTSSTEQDLRALFEISKRVNLDLSSMVLEPLAPGQKRLAALSIQVDRGWKTADVFRPSARGSRFTLSLPIGRTQFVPADSGKSDSKAPVGYLVPQGSMVEGTLQIDEPRPLSTELCTITFTMR